MFSEASIILSGGGGLCVMSLLAAWSHVPAPGPMFLGGGGGFSVLLECFLVIIRCK